MSHPYAPLMWFSELEHARRHAVPNGECRECAREARLTVLRAERQAACAKDPSPEHESTADDYAWDRSEHEADRDQEREFQLPDRDDTGPNDPYEERRYR